MSENILKQIKTECSFIAIPSRRIGHIHADHNGHRWRNTVCISHQELMTPAIAAEMDQVYGALTNGDALADFETLVHFCHSYPETGVPPAEGQENNFYLEGTSCNFRIRLFTGWRDYNMYLYAFSKD